MDQKSWACHLSLQVALPRRALAVQVHACGNAQVPDCLIKSFCVLQPETFVQVAGQGRRLVTEYLGE
jgi:hypothetical protein